MDSPKPPDSTGCQFHQFHNNHHHHHHPPVPHYHHYFHASPHCPLHNYMLHFKNQHSPTCPLFASSSAPPQNPQTGLASIPSISKESGFNPSGVMHKENEELEEEEYLQADEEEDPVFVLTDEWREFFAKSEANRRLAKKQPRKKGKNRMER